MTVITERALAKINLTLEVLGRRADGYHELLSLVAFASEGDVVTLDTEQPVGVAVAGPFAGQIGGLNIIDRTLRVLGERAPQLVLGGVHLDKRLPVAAGLGGGSANAAAVLRCVRRANAHLEAMVDWHEVALRLGADVPVCLASRATWMRGLGDVLEPVAGVLPTLHGVLVNPLAEVPHDKTARVFRALAAKPLDRDVAGWRAPDVTDRAQLLSFMRARGNDLTEPARAVVPAMTEVMRVLSEISDVRHVAVSGAGPTCFAIVQDEAAAVAQSTALRAVHPTWWVAPVTIG